MNEAIENKVRRNAGVWSKFLFFLSLCVGVAGIILTSVWFDVIWVWQNQYGMFLFAGQVVFLAIASLFVIFPIFARWQKRQFLDLVTLWVIGITFFLLLVEFIALFFVHFKISSPA